MESEKKIEILKDIVNEILDIVLVEDAVEEKVILTVKTDNVERLITHLVNEMNFKIAGSMDKFNEGDLKKIEWVAGLLGANPYQGAIISELNFDYDSEGETITILLGFDALFNKRTLEFYGGVDSSYFEYVGDYLYKNVLLDTHELIVELLEEVKGLDFDMFAEDGGVTAFLNYGFETKGIEILDVYSIDIDEFDDYDETEIEYITVMDIEMPVSVYKKYDIDLSN